jgi:hypothetical protein
MAGLPPLRKLATKGNVQQGENTTPYNKCTTTIVHKLAKKTRDQERIVALTLWFCCSYLVDGFYFLGRDEYYR